MALLGELLQAREASLGAQEAAVRCLKTFHCDFYFSIRLLALTQDLKCFFI